MIRTIDFSQVCHLALGDFWVVSYLHQKLSSALFCFRG